MMDPETHKLHREQWQVATQIAGDYGKWLVASLTLVHGGALYGIASNTSYRPAVLSQALWWFVFGLILSLFSGFVAWINWYLLAQSASALMRGDAPVQDKCTNWGLTLR